MKLCSSDNHYTKYGTTTLKYGIYCEDTMSDARGKTAKSWMIYCHLVDLYLLFHGAMKTCDVDLFTYVLHDMSKIFFTTNHQNYAKWMTRYSLELPNRDLRLRKMLMNGDYQFGDLKIISPGLVLTWP